MFHANSMNGGKAELADFMRYNHRPKEDKEATVDDVIATLRSVAKPVEKN